MDKTKTKKDAELLVKRYHRLCRQMQTAVAFMVPQDHREIATKHLRIGVNISHACSDAICNLLISKGIITEEEYWEALVEEMESQVDKYRVVLKKMYGKDVSLS